jgi:hypothetical protein
MRALILILMVALAGGCRTAPTSTGDDGGSGNGGGGGGSGGGGGGAGGGGGVGGGAVDMAGGGAHLCTIFCVMGLTCCGDNHCVNLRNDINNCGGCGITCTGPQPYCDGSQCAPAPCSPACGAGELCCDVRQNVTRPPACYAPVNGTCPVGCPLCS